MPRSNRKITGLGNPKDRVARADQLKTYRTLGEREIAMYRSLVIAETKMVSKLNIGGIISSFPGINTVRINHLRWKLSKTTIPSMGIAHIKIGEAAIIGAAAGRAFRGVVDALHSSIGKEFARQDREIYGSPPFLDLLDTFHFQQGRFVLKDRRIPLDFSLDIPNPFNNPIRKLMFNNLVATTATIDVANKDGFKPYALLPEKAASLIGKKLIIHHTGLMDESWAYRMWMDRSRNLFKSIPLVWEEPYLLKPLPPTP